MPNYCYNKVKSSKEVLEELYDNGHVTFQKLIPMPKELNLTEGTITEEAIIYAMSRKDSESFFKTVKELEKKKDIFDKNYWNRIKKRFSAEEVKKLERKAATFIPDEEAKALGIKTLKELGNQYISNIEKYNSPTWYDWSCDNWGTKWDAAESEGTPEDGQLTFYTAWSEPLPVIEKLMKKHSDKKIEWEYKEESGEFKGKIVSDGKGNISKRELERTEEEEDTEEI